jgi:hypothetical protein
VIRLAVVCCSVEIWPTHCVVVEIFGRDIPEKNFHEMHGETFCRQQGLKARNDFNYNSCVYILSSLLGCHDLWRFRHHDEVSNNYIIIISGMSFCPC